LLSNSKFLVSTGATLAATAAAAAYINSPNEITISTPSSGTVATTIHWDENWYGGKVFAECFKLHGVK
jgi:cobalamin biosynthesis protein CbiD